VKIPEGGKVAVMFASANRDEKVFDDPDRFDITRQNARDQMGFGFGPHYCIGAGLARKEMNVAFEVLLSRLSNMRLAPGNDFSHHPSLLLRGMKKLDVEFDAVV
jgi:cytochrome P450